MAVGGAGAGARPSAHRSSSQSDMGKEEGSAKRRRTGGMDFGGAGPRPSKSSPAADASTAVEGHPHRSRDIHRVDGTEGRVREAAVAGGECGGRRGGVSRGAAHTRSPWRCKGGQNAMGAMGTAVFYAVLTTLLLLVEGVVGVGGEDDPTAGAHSFAHDVNLADHKAGTSLRRLLQASEGIKIPPKMYGGEIRCAGGKGKKPSGLLPPLLDPFGFVLISWGLSRHACAPPPLPRARGAP